MNNFKLYFKHNSRKMKRLFHKVRNVSLYQSIKDTVEKGGTMRSILVLYTSSDQTLISFPYFKSALKCQTGTNTGHLV